MMTIRKHPDPSILLSYAAGALPGALAGVVAFHLSMCPRCRADVRRLEMLGGLLLEREGGIEALGSAKRQTAEHGAGHASLGAEPDQHPALADLACEILPLPLVRYLGMTVDDIPWQSLPKGMKQYWVKLPEGSGLMRLLKAPAKSELLAHSHRGMELTMILTGTYTDHTGDYTRGEVTEMTPGTHHHPKITSDTECICIIASEARPRYSKWYARMMRPILGF
ncbi:MAG: cupin domain-containing protein [Rhodomicrobiaceae bacterium]